MNRILGAAGTAPWRRKAEPFTVTSPLTAREAVRKLSDALGESSKYYAQNSGWTSWIVKGYATDGRVEVVARPAGGGARNSWRPRFTGTVGDLPQGGSELTGTVGPSSYARAVSLAAAVVAALFFATGLAAAIMTATRGHWVHALPPLGFSGAALLFYCWCSVLAEIGTRRGRADGQYVRRWLSEQLIPNQVVPPYRHGTAGGG